MYTVSLMSNINTANNTNSNKSNKRKNLGYALMIATLLGTSSPTEAKTGNIMNNKQSIEVVDNWGIISNIEKRTWIKLPNEYTDKLNNFVTTNKIMKSRNWIKFTEDFIVNQLKYNWNISKKNQLLFIRSAVYKQLTNNDLYDWSDWDDNRLDEFSNVIDNIEQCWNDYINWINAYMKKISADAKQQSAEARQQSAEARQQSAEARQQSIESTYDWLKQIKDYYYLCINNPNAINDDELNGTKKYAKYVIQNCKRYHIDYKTKLSPEVRNFYGID